MVCLGAVADSYFGSTTGADTPLESVRGPVRHMMCWNCYSREGIHMG